MAEKQVAMQGAGYGYRKEEKGRMTMKILLFRVKRKRELEPESEGQEYEEVGENGRKRLKLDLLYLRRMSLKRGAVAVQNVGEPDQVPKKKFKMEEKNPATGFWTTPFSLPSSYYDAQGNPMLGKSLFGGSSIIVPGNPALAWKNIPFVILPAPTPASDHRGTTGSATATTSFLAQAIAPTRPGIPQPMAGQSQVASTASGIFGTGSSPKTAVPAPAATNSSSSSAGTPFNVTSPGTPVLQGAPLSTNTPKPIPPQTGGTQVFGSHPTGTGDSDDEDEDMPSDDDSDSSVMNVDIDPEDLMDQST